MGRKPKEITLAVDEVRIAGDLRKYQEKAIELGATMILAQRPLADLTINIPDNIVYLQVADTAETMAWLAAASPSRFISAPFAASSGRRAVELEAMASM